MREICAAAQFVAVETNYSGRLLAQKCPESASKIYRVFNGIDLGSLPPPRASSQNGAARILSVGRLVPFKGFDHLIDACADMARRNLDFTCEIVGDGPERERLQTKIDSHNLGSRIALLGSLPRETIFEKMQAADIFALASVVDRNGASDVFPTVILEAMAAARPVVSTQVAGIPESVVAGETGLLVPPANAAALAEALAQLIVDLPLREQFGRAGRARLEENFTINKTIAPLVQLLRRSPAAEKKPAVRPRIKQIVYLIDRWPDETLPMLEWELKEMKWRNIAILPIVCEFDFQAHLLEAHDAVAPTLEFLPDAMAIEAEWLSNRPLAQKLEDDHAAGEQRVPAGHFPARSAVRSEFAEAARGEKCFAYSRDQFARSSLRGHLARPCRSYNQRHNRAPTSSLARMDQDRSPQLSRRTLERSQATAAPRQFFSVRQSGGPEKSATTICRKDRDRFDRVREFLAGMVGVAGSLEPGTSGTS